MADNLGFALRVMEGNNEYVRFVTTDGSEEVDFSKSVKLDGGMTLGGGISVPASQDITLVASNSNALDFVIASGNRMMRFNTSTETVLMEQNIDVGGTANLDAVDIDGDVDGLNFNGLHLYLVTGLTAGQDKQNKKHRCEA